MSSNELVEQIMAQVVARVSAPPGLPPLQPTPNERRLWQKKAAV